MSETAGSTSILRVPLAEAGGRTAVAGLIGLSGLVMLFVWQVILLSLVRPFVGEGPVVLTVTSVLATGLGMGTVAALYLRSSDRGIEYLDLRIPDARDLAYVVGGVAALIAMLYGSSFVFQLIGIEQATHGTVVQAQANPAILLVSIPASWLLIGPGEELLYRNVVQKSLYDAFSRPAAIVVATLIFAVAHFPAYLSLDPSVNQTLGQTAASLVVVFVLSLVLGVVYERTESLVVSALVHGTFNAVQFADLYCELTGVCPVPILP